MVQHREIDLGGDRQRDEAGAGSAKRQCPRQRQSRLHVPGSAYRLMEPGGNVVAANGHSSAARGNDAAANGETIFTNYCAGRRGATARAKTNRWPSGLLTLLSCAGASTPPGNLNKSFGVPA